MPNLMLYTMVLDCIIIINNMLYVLPRLLRFMRMLAFEFKIQLQATTEDKD